MMHLSTARRHRLHIVDTDDATQASAGLGQGANYLSLLNICDQVAMWLHPVQGVAQLRMIRGSWTERSFVSGPPNS